MMNPITAALVFCCCAVAVKRVRFFQHSCDELYPPAMESHRQFDQEEEAGCYLDEVNLLQHKPKELVDYICECFEPLFIKSKTILRKTKCRPNIPPPTEATGLTSTQLLHLRLRTQQAVVIRQAEPQQATESDYKVCVAYLKRCEEDVRSLPCPEKTKKAAERIIRAWEFQHAGGTSSSSSSSYGAEFFEE